MRQLSTSSDEWYNKQITDNYFLSPNSIETYLANIKAVQRICDGVTIHQVLLNPTKYAPMIQDDDICLNSQHSYFIVVLTYIKLSGIKTSNHDVFVKWYKHILKVKRKIKYFIDNNIPMDKQKRNIIIS